MGARIQVGATVAVEAPRMAAEYLGYTLCRIAALVKLAGLSWAGQVGRNRVSRS